MCSVEWTASEVTAPAMAFQLNAVANIDSAQVLNVSSIMRSLRFKQLKINEKLFSNVFKFSMHRQVAISLPTWVPLPLGRVLFNFQELQSKMQMQDFNQSTHFAVRF